MRQSLRVCIVMLLLTALVRPALAAVHWTAEGPNDDWATGDNWSNELGPGPFETALFDNAGASTIPGEVTNYLTADRTIGGLTYSNANRYHTTDLGGATLTVEGNLNFNVNQPGHTTTVIRRGALVVGGGFANVNVGRSYSGGAWAVANLGGLAEFNGQGETRLARLFSLIYLGDFTSVYLALLGGINPKPVQVIDYLKQELSKIQ